MTEEGLNYRQPRPTNLLLGIRNLEYATVCDARPNRCTIMLAVQVGKEGRVASIAPSPLILKQHTDGVLSSTLAYR